MWISNKTEAANASEEHSAIAITEGYTHSKTEYEVLYIVNRIILGMCWSAAVLSLATVIFGLISWILIPKWRNFRNFVLQNIILCCLIYTSCPLHVYFTRNSNVIEVIRIIFVFDINVFVHWLVVATVMFYMDLVRVFNNNFRYKFLLSIVFAWMVPVIVTILYVYANFPPAYLTTTETILNFLLYVLILISLCNLNSTGAGKQQTCRIVLFSTLSFIITGFLLYFPALVGHLGSVTVWSMKFVSALFMVTAIVISVSFVFMKSNRTLWSEYWTRARNHRQTFKL